MKLEVGMYVRTDLGNIGKIVEEYTHQNNKVSYPEPQEWVLDTGYILNEAMMYKNEEITKASHNIIDLIEVGDYVNGCKVSYIENDDRLLKLGLKDYQKVFCEEYEKDLYAKVFKVKDIKSIVTKQQFSSIEYRLGE